MTIQNFLRELPKCEHHLHIEGTLEPDLLFDLAARNNVKLPLFFPPTVAACNDRYKRFADLQDFLDHYYVGMSVLQSEQDFYDLATAYLRRAHADGCVHSEMFFDPQAHTERGIAIDTVVHGLSRACQDAESKFGVSHKLTMCLLRHLPPEDGMKTVESAHKFYTLGLVHGLGLDSAEAPFPPQLFQDCFAALRENFPHANFTAHAGEEGDHTRVSDTLDVLGVTRIDHGVNARQSPELMNRLAENSTLLSMCPLSNVRLQVVSHVRELPFRDFFDRGVRFSINSDDPAYFGGYILDNYLAVHESFNFSLKDWVKIALNGIHGSWCSDERKGELERRVNEVYEKYAA